MSAKDAMDDFNSATEELMSSIGSEAGARKMKNCLEHFDRLIAACKFHKQSLHSECEVNTIKDSVMGYINGIVALFTQIKTATEYNFFRSCVSKITDFLSLDGIGYAVSVKIVPIIYHKIVDPDISVECSCELLKVINILLAGKGGQSKATMFQELDLNCLSKLAKLLTTCGSFEYQTAIIENLRQVAKFKYIHHLLPDDANLQGIMNTRDKNFDVRMLLNYMNRQSNLIFPIEAKGVIFDGSGVWSRDCDKWIDFNIKQRRINFHCCVEVSEAGLLLDAADDATRHGLATILEDSIDNIKIISLEESCILGVCLNQKILLYEGAPPVFVRDVILIFEPSEELQVLCEIVLPDMFPHKMKEVSGTTSDDIESTMDISPNPLSPINVIPIPITDESAVTSPRSIISLAGDIDNEEGKSDKESYLLYTEEIPFQKNGSATATAATPKVTKFTDIEMYLSDEKLINAPDKRHLKCSLVLDDDSNTSNTVGPFVNKDVHEIAAHQLTEVYCSKISFSKCNDAINSSEYYTAPLQNDTNDSETASNYDLKSTSSSSEQYSTVKCNAASDAEVSGTVTPDLSCHEHLKEKEDSPRKLSSQTRIRNSPLSLILEEETTNGFDQDVEIYQAAEEQHLNADIDNDIEMIKSLNTFKSLPDLSNTDKELKSKRSKKHKCVNSTVQLQTLPVQAEVKKTNKRRKYKPDKLKSHNCKLKDTKNGAHAHKNVAHEKKAAKNLRLNDTNELDSICLISEYLLENEDQLEDTPQVSPPHSVSVRNETIKTASYFEDSTLLKLDKPVPHVVITYTEQKAVRDAIAQQMENASKISKRNAHVQGKTNADSAVRTGKMISSAPLTPEKLAPQLGIQRHFQKKVKKQRTGVFKNNEDNTSKHEKFVAVNSDDSTPSVYTSDVDSELLPVELDYLNPTRSEDIVTINTNAHNNSVISEGLVKKSDTTTKAIHVNSVADKQSYELIPEDVTNQEESPKNDTDLQLTPKIVQNDSSYSPNIFSDADRNSITNINSCLRQKENSAELNPECTENEIVGNESAVSNMSYEVTPKGASHFQSAFENEDQEEDIPWVASCTALTRNKTNKTAQNFEDRTQSKLEKRVPHVVIIYSEQKAVLDAITQHMEKVSKRNKRNVHIKRKINDNSMVRTCQVVQSKDPVKMSVPSKPKKRQLGNRCHLQKAVQKQLKAASKNDEENTNKHEAIQKENHLDHQSIDVNSNDSTPSIYMSYIDSAPLPVKNEDALVNVSVKLDYLNPITSINTNVTNNSLVHEGLSKKSDTTKEPLQVNVIADKQSYKSIPEVITNQADSSQVLPRDTHVEVMPKTVHNDSLCSPDIFSDADRNTITDINSCAEPKGDFTKHYPVCIENETAGNESEVMDVSHEISPKRASDKQLAFDTFKSLPDRSILNKTSSRRRKLYDPTDDQYIMPEIEESHEPSLSATKNNILSFNITSVSRINKKKNFTPKQRDNSWFKKLIFRAKRHQPQCKHYVPVSVTETPRELGIHSTITSEELRKCFKEYMSNFLPSKNNVNSNTTNHIMEKQKPAQYMDKSTNDSKMKKKSRKLQSDNMAKMNGEITMPKEKVKILSKVVLKATNSKSSRPKNNTRIQSLMDNIFQDHIETDHNQKGIPGVREKSSKPDSSTVLDAVSALTNDAFIPSAPGVNRGTVSESSKKTVNKASSGISVTGIMVNN